MNVATAVQLLSIGVLFTHSGYGCIVTMAVELRKRNLGTLLIFRSVKRDRAAFELFPVFVDEHRILLEHSLLYVKCCLVLKFMCKTLAYLNL
jgi:hypothetical protein